MTEIETRLPNPREREAAVAAFVADICEVVSHVARDPAYGWPRTLDRLAASVVARTCPDPDVLRTVAGYVYVVLPHKARYEPLTADEQHVLKTARLFVACVDRAHRVR